MKTHPAEVRRRAPSPSDTDEACAINCDADPAWDLEHASKTVPSPHESTTPRSFRVAAKEAASLCVAWVLLAIVVDPPFVVYYLLALVLSVWRAVRAQKQGEDGARGPPRFHWAVVAFIMVGGGMLLRFIQEFEIQHIGTSYAFPRLSTEPGVVFYRMTNPSSINYIEDVETIHARLNNGPPRTQRLEIDSSVDVWASDVYRFEFLRHVWRSNEQQTGYRVVCLAESDFVFDEEYIASVLLPEQPQDGEIPSQPLGIAHVQHFWGHHVFEPFNIGLLCTSSHASPGTQWWTRLTTPLYRKRYRRLLFLDLLYALLPERLVLDWDAHHGCTTYYPHCKYIHFTRPKYAGIEQALIAVQADHLASKIKD